MSATALLIVDVQRNMFESSPPVADGIELLATLAELIARARTAGAHVVFVRNNGTAPDPDVPGTPGWELVSALPRLSAEPIVDKRAPDAFEGTNLGGLLKARGVRRIVVAGLQSEFCIAATCRGGKMRGYEVTLVRDGHGTMDGPAATAQAIIARENAALAAESVAELVAADAVKFV